MTIKMRNIFLKITIFFFSHTGKSDSLSTSDIFLIKKKIFENSSEKTLVAFDVDDVIVMPTEDYYLDHPTRKKIVKEYKTRLSKERYQSLVSKIMEQRKVMLVSPELPNLLNEIHHKKISSIAVTKWWTGKLGDIQKMETLRFKDLESVGISFRNLIPFLGTMRFPELNIGKGIPLYQDGVAMTSLAEKAAVLNGIMTKSGKKFSTVILIDDDKTNFLPFEKLGREMQFTFIGIEFTAAKQRKLSYEVIEAEERQRFDILEKEGIFLSQQDLKQRLAKKK